MTKVTIHNSGEAALPVPPSNNPAASTVKDSLGRTITIQEPSVLQESRLVRVLGDAATNAAYMTAYALPAAMVTAIDDDPVAFPSSQAEVDIAIKRLGREGMGAVMNHIIATAEASRSSDPTGAQESIKK